jgi:hypothetical protein
MRMLLPVLRRPALAAPLLAVTLLALEACKPTCQSTCRRFYDPTECNATPQGVASEEAIEGCIDVCQDALQITGPEVDPDDRRFNPDFIAPLNQTSTLASEREAAAWMDCVWSFSDDECESRLGDQYCVKIF